MLMSESRLPTVTIVAGVSISFNSLALSGLAQGPAKHAYAINFYRNAKLSELTGISDDY